MQPPVSLKYYINSTSRIPLMLILMGLIIEPMTFPNQVNRNGQGLGSFSSQLTGACQPVFYSLNQTVGGGLHCETPSKKYESIRFFDFCRSIAEIC
ncbi:hypothetical protein PtA15_3A894 [Puccinia triticina]|uniref:Uncharacterized protein n=1 Tax=Puccinia triticina TaxID=208348 RepID=A0ABY7CF21_9BASI|nr:uncharacterized protein PtA15_3A894 [Puccinia triticina]WAQ83523.1 hypothetical protein PtA15_3A894 [Puccinia triticina]